MVELDSDDRSEKKLPYLAQIREKVRPQLWIDVEPIHCHQRVIVNQLVSKVRAISPDWQAVEAELRFVPEELSFFFDHPIDHLPGMLETNALRQMVLATSHLIYQEPLSKVALAGWIKIKFYSYGELGTDTFAKLRLLDVKSSRLKSEYVVSVVMHQATTKIMRFDAQLIMMEPKLAAKVRHLATTLDQPEDEHESRFFG